MRHDPVTFEFELPDSGRKVRMRELTGEDELHAASEVADPSSTGGRVALDYAMIQRSIVAIDGQPFDQSSVIGAGVRSLFSPRDFQCIRAAFHKFHTLSQEEADAFLGRIRITAG